MDYLGNHISGQFDAELSHVRTQLMSMGGLVEKQLTKAVSLFSSYDEERAQSIIDTDEEVNTLEVAIDEACVKIIAKRQPTAGDLRLLMVVIRTIAELERIGDSARDICLAVQKNMTEEEQRVFSGVDTMGNTVIQMLHDVLHALTRMDINEAVRVYKEDKRVAQKYEMLIRQHMTFMMENPNLIPTILHALNCARDILRISSRCQNICEFIFYFIKGQNFRHVGDDVINELLNES